MKIIKIVIALGFVNYIYACVPYLTNIYNEFHNMDGTPLTEGKKIFSLCSIIFRIGVPAILLNNVMQIFKKVLATLHCTLLGSFVHLYITQACCRV